jgi:hypothetical protein
VLINLTSLNINREVFMKRNLKVTGLLMILALFSVFMISSCSEDNTPSGTNDMNVDSYDQMVAYEGFDEVELYEATIDDEPALIYPVGDQDLDPANIDRRERMRDQRPDKRHPLRMFGPVFREMELTEEQRLALRPIFQSHFECVKELMIQLRQSEREIIADAREERRAIIEQLRNEEITREEARELLRQLNMETREALRTNPLREEIRESLQDCREALLENIAELLTEEQLEIWNEWLERWQD